MLLRVNAEEAERRRRIEAARTGRVVYSLPGMDRVDVRRDVPYKPGPSGALCLDVYEPLGPLDAARGPLTPAVIFVSGGGALKDWGAFTSYGRLAAAAGLAAVTFDTHPAGTWEEEHLLAADVDDVIGHLRAHGPELGIDADRLALWAFSAGTLFGLRSVMRDTPPYIRCLVSFYGALDSSTFGGDTRVDVTEYSPLRYLRAHPAAIPPLFIARAGKDRPALNAALDRYVSAALELNADVQVHNHAEAPHGFSVLHDSPRSREIIRAALDFLVARLTPPRVPDDTEQNAGDLRVGD